MAPNPIHPRLPRSLVALLGILGLPGLSIAADWDWNANVLISTYDPPSVRTEMESGTVTAPSASLARLKVEQDLHSKYDGDGDIVSIDIWNLEEVNASSNTDPQAEGVGEERRVEPRVSASHGDTSMSTKLDLEAKTIRMRRHLRQDEHLDRVEVIHGRWVDGLRAFAGTDEVLRAYPENHGGAFIDIAQIDVAGGERIVGIRYESETRLDGFQFIVQKFSKKNGEWLPEGRERYEPDNRSPETIKAGGSDDTDEDVLRRRKRADLPWVYGYDDQQQEREWDWRYIRYPGHEVVGIFPDVDSELILGLTLHFRKVSD